jgi:hypothetical protein
MRGLSLSENRIDALNPRIFNLVDVLDNKKFVRTLRRRSRSVRPPPSFLRAFMAYQKPYPAGRVGSLKTLDKYEA